MSSQSLVQNGVGNAVVSVNGLTPHPRNYNQHSAGQVGDLRRSLRRFGQVRSIVVQAQADGERYLIVAGHGIVQAARAEGIESLRADIIPADWNDVMVLAYLAADNELARQGSADEAQLAALLRDVQAQADRELASLAAGSEARLTEMLATLGEGADGDAEPQVDRAAELQEKWQVQPGDVWRIGEHRRACGDCTDKATVERVMGGDVGNLLLTDPPYNVGIEYGAGTNDRKTLEQNEAFITKWFECYSAVPVKVLTPGAGYYLGTLRSWLTLFPPRWMCIWVRKNSMSHSPLRGFQAWEPVLFYANEEDDAVTEWGGALVYGKVSKSIKQDVFTIPIGVQKDVADEHGNKLHPTPKPRQLFDVLLRSFSDIGWIVVDPFLGSGTTLVACQNLGRRGRGIEISAEYCAVVLERMATAFPGIEIERVVPRAKMDLSDEDATK